MPTAPLTVSRLSESVDWHRQVGLSRLNAAFVAELFRPANQSAQSPFGSIAFVYTYKHARLTLTQHYDPACRRRALKIPRVDVHSARPSADDDHEEGRLNAGRWARPKTRMTHWQRIKGQDNQNDDSGYLCGKNQFKSQFPTAQRLGRPRACAEAITESGKLQSLIQWLPLELFLNCESRSAESSIITLAFTRLRCQWTVLSFQVDWPDKTTHGNTVIT